MSEETLNPGSYPDSVCRALPPDVFFPDPNHKKRIQRAQAYCLGCPRMVACARWALPQITAGELSECVIASVYVPGHRATEKFKAAAVQTLAKIADAHLPQLDEVA